MEKLVEQVTCNFVWGVRMEDKELRGLRFQTKMDVLIALELLLCKLHDGWACKTCKMIQGEENKGIKKYYCQHVEAKITNELKDYSEKVTLEGVSTEAQLNDNASEVSK